MKPGTAGQILFGGYVNARYSLVYTARLMKKKFPGGCVAGAGTILNVEQAAKFVDKYASEARTASPLESPYRDVGEKLD